MTTLFRWRMLGLILLSLTLPAILLLSQSGGARPEAGAAPPPPAVADTGILTSWPLPLDRGPWQLKWDDQRNQIWFAEGNHSVNGVDQVGNIDPATNVLREWGIPTQGAYIHGTAIDRSGNIWFTEVRSNKIGRLVPETNTITEWTLGPDSYGIHGITVDDIVTGSVTIWLTERDNDIIGSLDPVTGAYVRHKHPIANSRPHSVFVAPDHSVWFVDTCGNRAGQLIPGNPDIWTLWQSPTPPQCSAPNGIGPLFGRLVGSDFWFTEAYNNNAVRLRPADNTLTIWHVPGGTKLLTQLGNDPDGNIFFSEMQGNAIGRLEPVGTTTPTVVVVQPTVLSVAPTPQVAAVPPAVVYTPIVTQLTPATRVLVGARTGSITQWVLPTVTSTTRYIGPGRAWYGGGGFWVSEVSADRVSRFAPYTPTLAPTATLPPAATATPTFIVSPTPTPVPPSATQTAIPDLSPTSSPSPCTVAFTDVPSDNPFYVYIRCLACRGIVSGYSTAPPCAATPCFLPGANVTRGQIAKFVSNAAGYQEAIPSTQQTFSDVPYSNPFWIYVERAVLHGVISGYSTSPPCTTGVPCFLPGNTVTRGQTAKFVANAANYQDPIPSTQQTFSDVPASSPFWVYVERATLHGVISGYSTSPPCTTGVPCFLSGNDVTRGQTSKFIANGFFPNCQTPARR